MIIKPSSATLIPADTRKGFALVVTLTLMVLLSILALGLLSLASIEIRKTGQQDAFLQARANARLALSIALGELQKEMGPDQRISAPGGQLLGAADKSARSHWTGVHDSWPAASEQRPTPVFRRWLISGDGTVVRNLDAPKTGAPLASRTAILVAGDSGSDPIEAGLTTIESGAYAWWIADENAKAKLGNRVLSPADAEAAVARMQSAPRASHEMVLNGDFAKDAPEFDRLVSTGTTRILQTTPADLLHHVTVSATGLLTNVRSGGMRKDLSFFLEKPLAAVSKAPLYSAGSTPGFNFFELWRDTNVWGEIQYYPASPPNNHADGKPMPSGTPFLIANADPGSAKFDPFFQHKHPTKLQAATVCSLISEKSGQDSSGNDRYRLYLIFDPIYTIWNPSNVALQIPRSSYLTFKTWGFPYDLKLFPEGGNSNAPVSRSMNSLFLQENFFNAEIGKSQNLILRPGEVQIQSQGFNQPIRDVRANKYTSTYLGWDSGSGFKYEYPYTPSTDKKWDGKHSLTYSLVPNTTNSKNYALHLNGYSIGAADTGSPTHHVGSFAINFSPAGNSSIKATDHPKIFPTIERSLELKKTVEQLANGDKWPICIFTFGIKTANDEKFDEIPAASRGTRHKGRTMLRFNPATNALDLLKLEPEIVRASPLQIGMRRLSSLSDLVVACDTDGLGYYGASYGSADGVSHVIAHAVPTSPIHSLGALQNAVPEGTRYGTDPNEIARSLLPAIQCAIGNSFAPSVMGPEKTSTTIGGLDAADHSYLANKALWDDWFFSSVSPETAPAYKNAGTAYSEQKGRLERFLKGSEPLPNSRFLPWTRNPAASVQNVFNGSVPTATAHERTAELIVVDGMFNVNSTSVPAWKSFLAGLKGESVPVRQTPATPSVPTLVAVTETPVSGLMVPGGGKIPDNTLSDPKNPEQWIGFRALTDVQIGELATAIVKQVRLRGPFTSLADFVNRRPVIDKDLALSGALQSALDDPSVSINNGFRQGERSLSKDDAAGFEFPEAEAGPKSVGSPGYVKQADLLTALGPLISVRGDTFLIRAYGESRDKNNKVIARAWCEATVRRVPDYVDPSDNPHTSLPASQTNRMFGRKFEMLSFRFLSPAEIL